jgi:hypothetical protein
MNVRLNPTMPDETPPDATQAASDGPDPEAGPPELAVSEPSNEATVEEPGGSEMAPGEQESLTGGDGRRALREARRTRRRTAWLCAAVVALCLALTIAVVSLARYRPVPPPAMVASASQVTLSSAVPSEPSSFAGAMIASQPQRHLLASEGASR